MPSKKNIFAVLSLLFVITFVPNASILGEQIPGQVILKVTQQGKPEDILKGHEAQVRDSIPGSQTFLIEIDSAAGKVEEMIGELESDTQVVFVEPNYTVDLPETFQMSISFPDDNPRPLLLGVEPVEFFGQPTLTTINAELAYDIATGDGVNVAVIDNGVDFSHPFLSPRLLAAGWDFIDSDSDPSYETGLFADHGTFVSGLIALFSPDCRIMPVRAFDGDGKGSTYAVARAITYSVNHGADIINMSFGLEESNRAISQACNQALLNGVVMVAACGNNSVDSPTYPAALPGVIAVSGLNEQDAIASFSNYGEYIDVCAPAVNLYSTLAGENEWGTWSGTSFAAPLVTAVCAMVRELNPDYSAFLMQQHIRQAAATEFLWGTLVSPDIYYGFGRIDAYGAVNLDTHDIPPDLGDLNGDGEVNINDITGLIAFVYGNGPAPILSGNPDMNCDGIIDEYDIEFYIDRVFNHGPRGGRCN